MNTESNKASLKLLAEKAYKKYSLLRGQLDRALVDADHDFEMTGRELAGGEFSWTDLFPDFESVPDFRDDSVALAAITRANQVRVDAYANAEHMYAVGMSSLHEWMLDEMNSVLNEIEESA